MYTGLNQYHVVMEAAPQFWQDPQTLRDIYVTSPSGQEVPLSAITHYRADHRPAGGEPPGSVSGGDHFLQPDAGRGAGRRGGGHRGSGQQGGPSLNHPQRLCGNGPGLSGFAEQRAAADCRGAGRRVHRAGHPLRELHSPHHDSLHAAIGRCGRAAGAADLPHGSQHHRHDRHHPADRHRQEERHHDDRFRAGRRAQRTQELAGRDL